MGYSGLLKLVCHLCIKLWLLQKLVFSTNLLISNCSSFFGFILNRILDFKFMRIFLSILFSLTLISNTFAQAPFDTTGGRFRDFVFDTISITQNLPYSTALNAAGQMQTLNMDIYRPYNDPMQARPFMVLVHGGSFLQGNKTDLEETCRAFARKGYVTASIQYRLGYSTFTPAGVVQTVIRATQDLKNAVRFLRKSVTLSNPYQLHPDYAFVGGVSAGAITSLHAAYMDQLSEILPGQTIPSLDSLHNAGQIPGFDWRFKAVINIAGGIGDTNWIQPGDVPVISLQGTDDAVVPYESGSFGGTLPLFGSLSIFERTQNLGIRSEIRPFEGAGHDYSVGNPWAVDTTIARITSFLLPFLTNSTTQTESPQIKNTVRVFMQSDGWQVETGSPGFDLKLYDFQGRILQQKSEGSASLSIPATSGGRVLLITTSDGLRKSWILPACQP